MKNKLQEFVNLAKDGFANQFKFNNATAKYLETLDKSIDALQEQIDSITYTANHICNPMMKLKVTSDDSTITKRGRPALTKRQKAMRKAWRKRKERLAASEF